MNRFLKSQIDIILPQNLEYIPSMGGTRTGLSILTLTQHRMWGQLFCNIRKPNEKIKVPPVGTQENPIISWGQVYLVEKKTTIIFSVYCQAEFNFAPLYYQKLRKHELNLFFYWDIVQTTPPITRSIKFVKMKERIATLDSRIRFITDITCREVE